jgi:stress response protein SCP2
VPQDCQIKTLRNSIQKHLGIEVAYQRLVFNGKELDINSTLIQNGIVQGSKIHVQQVLLAIHSESELKHVKFQLQWGYRTPQPAFMDGSCFAYCGENYYCVTDFKDPYQASGIRHLGKAKVVHRNKTASQEISVELDSLHPSVTYLFFVLSACRVKNLAQFIRPTVNMYDTAKPDVKLSDYEIESAGNSKAVVMCRLQKGVDGWKVVAVGRPANGNVYNYNQIQHTIEKVLAEEMENI